MDRVQPAAYITEALVKRHVDHDHFVYDDAQIEIMDYPFEAYQKMDVTGLEGLFKRISRKGDYTDKDVIKIKAFEEWFLSQTKEGKPK